MPLGLTVPAKAPRPETMGGDEARRSTSLTLVEPVQWRRFMHAQTGEPFLVLDRAS